MALKTKNSIMKNSTFIIIIFTLEFCFFVFSINAQVDDRLYKILGVSKDSTDRQIKKVCDYDEFFQKI